MDAMPWPREVASTVAEHTNIAARDRVSTNAPGRIEGSREHTNLVVTRRRDDRQGRLRHTIHAHLDRGQTRRP